MLTLDDFTDDAPWEETVRPLAEYRIDGQIADVVLRSLSTREDGRGSLTVLLSDLYMDLTPPPPHVYWVRAQPKSVRAWVYHKRQEDRLAFIEGDIVVALHDLRPDSPTYRALNVIEVGAARPTLLTIPRRVVHGVYNRGSEPAAFVNMPTRAYDPARPDKSRLRYPHEGIPYRFA